MPYTTSDPNSTVEDGKVQLGALLDHLVSNGTLTPDQATQTAQERGLTTGPGDNVYQAPDQPQADAATLNEQSRQSAARSTAYQASRAGNPEGYTKESQDEWDATHPLGDYQSTLPVYRAAYTIRRPPTIGRLAPGCAGRGEGR